MNRQQPSRQTSTIGMALSILLGFGAEAGSPPAASTRSGVTGWAAEKQLTSAPGASKLSYNFARSIAADGQGRVHVVWYSARDGNEQVYYKRSVDEGATWGPDSRLSDSTTRMPTDPIQPAIAVSGLNVYVVWHEVRRGKLDVYLRRSLDGGLTWQPVDRVSNGNGSSAHASIAAWEANVFVVYGDHRDGNQAEVYFRRSSNAGKSWEGEVRISDTPYESWVPTVAVSGNDVLVAWVDYRDANEEEYLRRSIDGGVTWGASVRLTNDQADSWAPSMAVAGKQVHFTWFDRRDAGVTDAEVEAVLEKGLGLVGLPPEPAPPRDAATYYLNPFMARVQRKIRRIHAAAPTWVRRGGNPAELEGILKQFESLTRLWSTGWEIYYERSSDGGATWAPDVRLTHAPGASARPSVAVSKSDVYVVWFDER
ncbi:MAG: sialidase family protein, partial [Gammaproteobacteria bacterium]